MKLGKYSKILFATICVSVIVHFIFRNKSIIEGNTNADDATSEPVTETPPATDTPATESSPATETLQKLLPPDTPPATETTTESATEEPQSEPVEECKASGEAGNFDEDCKRTSYIKQF